MFTFTFLKRFAFELNINSSLKTTAISNWRYCVYSTSEGLLNVAGVHLFSVAIFYFFGASVAGQFYLASQISFVPVSFLGLAAGQAILAHAATAESEGRLGEILSELTTKIILIGAPLFLCIALIGPDLVTTVFGSSWREQENLCVF